jgi:hypothetical protein
MKITFVKRAPAQVSSARKVHCAIFYREKTTCWVKKVHSAIGYSLLHYVLSANAETTACSKEKRSERATFAPLEIRLPIADNYGVSMKH